MSFSSNAEKKIQTQNATQYTAEYTLYYVHDPMCSWCFGFQSVWEEVKLKLPDEVNLHYLVGGLAPDADVPMPASMQEALQNTWRNIESQIPGVRFNFDFWQRCTPKRSTYPACRAVLVASLAEAHYQGQNDLDSRSRQEVMIRLIQKAYYKEARNPSELATLCELAEEAGMSKAWFKKTLLSPAIQHKLMDDIAFARRIGGNSFPSLFLAQRSDTDAGLGKLWPIALSYTHADKMLAQIKQCMSL